MFLGIVATTKKEIYKQKSNERTIHLCDRANKLTEVVIPNADTLSFGDLVILDVRSEDSYNFKKIKNPFETEQNQMIEDLLSQLYNLIEREKEMLKVDEEIFKKNFGDFGKLGEEIFLSFSDRYRLIRLLKTKFCEISSNVKCNQNNANDYLKVQCLKIIGEMQFSNIALNHWLRSATSILHFVSKNYDIDKDLLIKAIESLLNVYVDDLDKNQLKIQLEQELRDKLNELKGNQKKLV